MVLVNDKNHFVLVDTHAHLNDPEYARDVDEVRTRAREVGVGLIICVGYDLASSRHAVHLAWEYPSIYAAVGFHPHDAAQIPPPAWENLEILAQDARVVALGEAGLDFFRNFSPREVQEEVFRRQLQLAQKLGLPVIVHDREAHTEVLAILEEFPALKKVVFHCFSGGPEMAEECLRRGYYLSVAGNVTYPKPGRLAEVVKKVPLDQLLLETDSPHLTPQPWRGKRNEPAYLPAVAEAVAHLKGVSPERIVAATTTNARRFFGLSL